MEPKQMKELVELIMDDLNSRKNWEDRQSLYYQMRHDGLPRKFKPWAHAADLHHPLADSMIEKHKPFYYNLIYGTELVATFISLQQQNQQNSVSVSQWFDWNLKQKTNMEISILTMLDFFLMTGIGLIKVFWNEDKKRLCFQSIDPVYFVVPFNTRQFAETDRACIIQQYSVEAYKRNKQFNQDDAFIKSISGRGEQPLKTDVKYAREGITYGQKDKEIIIWEIYTRTSENEWEVSWVSPINQSDYVRKKIKLVYAHKQLPIIYFQREVKDEGFYSPRGIPELVQHDECYLTKLLNEKADSLTLYNRPIYTSQGAIPNAANLKLMPGQIIPNNLQRVDPGPAPVGFDSEIMLHRQLAEYRVGIPDFGIGQSQGSRENKTATEVQAIGNLMSAGMDMRGRIFRLSLAKMFNQAWALLKQFDNKDLNYWINDQHLSLSDEAISGEYAITPNGSADNINKQLMLQKAVARMQMFSGNPFIQQNELVKSVIEVDDPRLVNRLYIEPVDKNMDQAEEQADEISNMLIGFPSMPSATDDHAIHLSTLTMFIEKRAATRDAITPEQAALMMNHGGAHHQALQKDTGNGKDFLVQWRGRIEAAVGWLTGLIQGSRPPKPMTINPTTGKPIIQRPTEQEQPSQAPAAEQPQQQLTQQMGGIPA